MATETTKTHAGLVCGLQEISATDIVDIQLPRRSDNSPAGTKVATRIRSGKFPHNGTGAICRWLG
jgi:hypothetical protein